MNRILQLHRLSPVTGIALVKNSRRPLLFVFCKSLIILMLFSAGFPGVASLKAAKMKPGPRVSTRAGLEAYTGVKSADMIADEDARLAFILWARKVKVFFREGVDAITPDVQVILCPATADYLYSSYTPTTVNYKKGTRPFLEKIVDEVTDGLSSDRDKVLALMRYVRDLSPYPHKGDLFVGGTEEEIIKKRALVCNEKARALIILWQVAGYPSRYIGHHIVGHSTTEVYFDGKWAYFDVRGKYFLKEDGSFANTWELQNNPSLITSQKAEVYLDMVSSDHNIKYSRNFFHPREVTGINNYFVSDAGKYDYSWQIAENWAESSGYNKVQANYIKVRARVLGLNK